MKAVRMLLTFIFVIVGLFVLLAAGLYLFQDRVVFVPQRDFVITPDQVNLKWDDIYIEVGNGEKINGWFISAPESSRENDTVKTVLFCHGNAGNISHRTFTLQFLHGLGVEVFIFDYRGYGQSGGTPSEQNLYEDTRAAYDWLLNEKGVAPENLYVLGRSLGGAPAIELVSQVPCGGVIVESSFSSAADIGNNMFPWLPAKLISRFKLDSVGKIGQLTCPVLVTHSPDDRLIPYEMGRALFEAAREPKTFIDLMGDHNERDYFESDLYINGLRQFMGLHAESSP